METPDEQREKGKELFKVIRAEISPVSMIKPQTTDPGSSENTKPNKRQKDLHLALIVKQHKPKIKILKRARGGEKTSYLQRTG